MKVINLCDKYGFAEQSFAICKVMGLQALRRKRYGVALSWCLRAKDEMFSCYLTDQFLNHYMETGTFLQCDLIDNLGSSMLLSNKLTFLGKSKLEFEHLEAFIMPVYSGINTWMRKLKFFRGVELMKIDDTVVYFLSVQTGAD